MEPAIQIYIGAPVSIGSEVKALSQLRVDLQRAQIAAALLVNFQVRGRQIDCVVITENYAALLDFKNLNGPIRGGINGPWYLRDHGGAECRYEGENPYQQVLGAKLALSDELKSFYKTTGIGFAPEKGQFFRLLDAAVCILPDIAPGSRIVRGDFKCWIWGYPEAISQITTKMINPRWTTDEWGRFAESLNLERVSFDAAISPDFGNSERLLVSYSQLLRNSLLAETYPDLPGDGVSIPDDEHALLIGRSGIGKTSRLKSEAVSLANGGRLVLFCSGRHYTGNLDRLLTRSVAPFSKASAVQLVDAAAKCGWSVDLIVDGIDAPDQNSQQDLIQGSAAFTLRYGARVVISAMAEIALPPGIKCTTIKMPPLTDEHKLAIFKFHSVSDCVAHSGFLDAFETAHDIMVAAHSVSSFANTGSRADYYAAYVLKSLPQESRIVAGKLLRHVANYMHRKLVRSIEFPEFERVSTEFLASIGAPIQIADSLTRLPQVSVSEGVFSFNHDLWQDYLAAEWLLYAELSPAELCNELERPINRRLTPHVLGRVHNLDTALSILEMECGGGCVYDGLSGGLGAEIKCFMEKRCGHLWEDLIIDSGELHVTPIKSEPSTDGKTTLGWPEIRGKRDWSRLERSLSAWLCTKIHEPRFVDQLVQLLITSSCSLWSACESAAHKEAVSARGLFGNALHVLFKFSGPGIPLTVFGLFRVWREKHLWFQHLETALGPMKDRLQESLENCPPAATGPILFCLSAVLRLQDGDLALVEKVFHAGWQQPLHPIRMEMLDLVERYGHSLVTKAPALAESIRERLDASLGKNAFFNTFIFQALNALNAVPPPVTLEDAREELRQIISTEPEVERHLLNLHAIFAQDSDGSESLEKIRAILARGFVSTFWEEIFQGIHAEVYHSLGEEDQVRLMNLAAMPEDTSFGDTYVLEELLRLKHPSSADVFRLHAAYPRVNDPFQQDAIACWCLGIIGCARLGVALTEWKGGIDIASTAWRLIRELLFLLFCDGASDEDIDGAWLTLRSEAALGAVDVFFLIIQAERGGLGAEHTHHKCWQKLMQHKDHVRQIMEHSLLQNDKLVSLSKWDRKGERATFILEVLGDIGDQQSIGLLSRYVEDPALGADAVAAIEKLRKA